MRKMAAALAVVLAACGSPVTSQPDTTDPNNTTTTQHSLVIYTINGGNLNCKANDSRDYTSNGYHTYDCIWYCADYNGESGVYVDITFLSDGTTWHVDNTYTATGICQ